MWRKPTRTSGADWEKVLLCAVITRAGRLRVKTDGGNGCDGEDGKLGRNDIAETVKSVVQKRDQGLCNTLTGIWGR